eukprot:CAMPEP_0194561720 /NCGR_PEP_ID=MMETSP0292-20121207/2407_1 /TAXON_ID=39354 /ORGANISM="Heterosigma akashiwo, Strain CCMP2393" /LENGTH=129 /DNA_ID=CAMNT_0039410195 /DNA_START=143 /DNA_END=528 /DNA_ORIENTATION=+
MHRARVGKERMPNRILHDKDVARTFELHKKKMDSIKGRKFGTGTVDSTEPSDFESDSPQKQRKKDENASGPLPGYRKRKQAAAATDDEDPDRGGQRAGGGPHVDAQEPELRGAQAGPAAHQPGERGAAG